MKIRDLTNRLLNLVARRLLFLAEWISPKEPRDEISVQELEPGPPADWLERTRNIPPELWVDFAGSSGSGDASANMERDLGEIREGISTDRSVPEFAALPTNSASNFKGPATATQLEPLNIKRTRKLRFLQFNASEKGSAEHLTAPKNSSTEFYGTSSERALSNQLRIKTHNLGFEPSFPKGDVGLTPPTAGDKNPTKKEKTPSIARGLDQIEKGVERSASHAHSQSSTKLELPTAQPSDKTEIRLTSEHVKYSDPRVVPNKSTAERSTSLFTNSPTKSGFVHEVDAPCTTPSMHFRQDRSTTDINPNGLALQRNRKDLTVEDTRVFAGTPWVDLPDDFLPRSFEAGESSRSLTEHLLLLEREQAGNI